MNLKYLPIFGLAVGLGFSSASAGDRSFGDGLPDFLRDFDTNHDEVIDEEERQAIRDARAARHEERIARWDADQSGDLSPDEIDAVRQSILERIEAKRAEHFAKLAGEDGLLSADEFAGIPGMSWLSEARVNALFDRMDADDSENVTLEEFNARLRHHRQPGDGEGGEGEPDDGPDGEEPPERPGWTDWRDLFEQLRDRLRGGGGE